MEKIGANNKNKAAENKRVKFIVCDVVHDEVKDRMPANWDVFTSLTSGHPNM